MIDPSNAIVAVKVIHAFVIRARWLAGEGNEQCYRLLDEVDGLLGLYLEPGNSTVRFHEAASSMAKMYCLENVATILASLEISTLDGP